MLSKLYHAFAVVSIATVLAGGALLGLMYGKGKLTPERMEAIARVLRGETEQTAANTTKEAEDQQSTDEHATGFASADEVRRQRHEEQRRRALAERAHSDLLAQRELLDRALHELMIREEKFSEQQARWKTELAQERGAARDAGFEKETQYVAKLPPQQAKEHLVMKWKEHPADAVRLLAALPTSTGKRILEQLKTPDEIQIMHELLERLGQEQVEEVAAGSGKTAGD